MKRKILSLLLAVAMFCMLTFSVSAAEQQPIEELEISPRYTYLNSLSAYAEKGNGFITYTGDCVVRPTDEDLTLKVSLQESTDRITWTTVDSKTREYAIATGGHGLSGEYYSPIKGRYYRCLTMVWVGDPDNPIDSGSVAKIIQY